MSKTTVKKSPSKKTSTASSGGSGSKIEYAKSRGVTLRERPLSPHLSIYKPQISTVLSISHRGSGVFLVLGAAMLAWWLVAISCGGETYAKTVECFGSRLGIIIIFLSSFAAFFHLMTGIRHLFWDLGLGFKIKAMNITGILAVLAAIALTAVTWCQLWEKLNLAELFGVK